MRWMNYTLLLLFAALMLYASAGLPNRADPEAPANRDESVAGTPNAASYYIQNAYRDAHTPNIVTVVLADYRGFDTLGEVVVIFAAGMICYLCFRRRRETHAPRG